MIQCTSDRHTGAVEGDQMSSFARKSRYITRGEEKMTKTIVLFMCLAASSLSFDARAQDTEGAYTVCASVLNVEGAPDA